MEKSAEEIAVRIDSLLRSSRQPLLFVGAGVGCRVGFPSWSAWIEHLAQSCEAFDPLTAQLVRARAERKQFLSAADVYTSCQEIPSAERFRLAAELFAAEPSGDELEKLRALLALPMGGIITTNFDRSMHHAYARVNHRAAMTFELGEPQLGGAAMADTFFIARIHGKAEYPPSLVFDSQAFARVTSDTHYLEFLLCVLRTRPLIFLGFSFSDPAISHVLALYKEKCGPHFPQMHLAVIPSGTHALEQSLIALNIEVATYKVTDDHDEVWRAIRIASERPKADLPPVARTSSDASLHRIMAFAYAQFSSSGSSVPITEIVQDGLLLDSMPEKEGEISDIDLETTVSAKLGLRGEAATTPSSIARLLRNGRIIRTQSGHLARKEDDKSPIAEALQILAQAVVDRSFVISRVTVAEKELAAIVAALESLFLTRAWDLAAHFAGNGGGMATDLPRVSKHVLASHLSLAATSPRVGQISTALIDLLHNPEDSQAALLAQIGRTAFGLQLVMSQPRHVLVQRYALPERIYFDSNVLMPAITAGHPLQPVYEGAMQRLRRASMVQKSALNVVVGRQFLNEVVNHRQNAIELVEELSLNEPDRLEEHILFFGASNTNVFVGAYASFVGRDKRSVPFADFLKKHAPYVTEDDLERYLTPRGIRTVAMEFNGANQGLFFEHQARLEGLYEGLSLNGDLKKKSILIRHEAQQLVQLRLDHNDGIRSAFVTADARLRRLAQDDSYLRPLAGMMMTHVGLVAMVEVLVGGSVDSRSFARLMWAARPDSAQQALFDYFIRRALKRYDEGLTLGLEEVALRVAKNAAEAAKEERLFLFGKSVSDVTATTKFLDRFEESFFANMKQTIADRQK